MEHEPDTDQDQGLVQDLNSIVKRAIHRLDRDEEYQHEGAKDVRNEDLKHDRGCAKDDKTCEEDSANEEPGRILDGFFLEVIHILVQ